MNTNQLNIESYPTDPHFEKWNNLTITPNFVVPSHSYIQGEHDDISNEYEETRKRAPSTKGSIQMESMKSLIKQDEEMKAYNNKVSKVLDDIRQTNFFPNKHYRFPISNSPFIHAAVSDPNNWNAAINAYEDRLKALENEIDVREKDTLKLSDITKVLMEENNYLKDHIYHKNKEIQKVLQTIGLNDAETIKDLNYRLNLLQEESNVILSKFEESENLKNKKTKELDNKEIEFDKLSREYKTIRGNLSEALARESVLATQNQSLNVKYKKSQEKVGTLETALEEVSQKLHKLQNKHELTTNQLDNVKRNLEEVYENQNLENNDLLQKNVELLNKNEELEKLVKSQKKILEEREKESKKLNRDLSSIKLEDEEFLQRLQSMKNDLTHETRAKEAAQKNEKVLEERNKNFRIEIKELEDTMRSNEQDYKAAVEALTNELDRKSNEYDSKMERLKEKIKEITNEKDDIISSLRERIRKLEEAIVKNHSSTRNTNIEIKDTLSQYNDYGSSSGPNKAINDMAREILQNNATPVLLTPKGDIYVNQKPEQYSYTTPNYQAYNGYNDITRKVWDDSTAVKSFNDGESKTDYYLTNNKYDLAYENLRQVKSAKEFEPVLYKEDYSPSRESTKSKKTLSHKQVKDLVAGILKKNDSDYDMDKYRLGYSLNSASSRASINQRASEKPARSFKPYSPSSMTGKGDLTSLYHNYKPGYLVSFKD